MFLTTHESRHVPSLLIARRVERRVLQDVVKMAVSIFH